MVFASPLRRSNAIDASSPADNPHLPFANHRDIYLLVAGVLLGIVLSPAVLGRAAPGAYSAMFGSGDRVLETFDDETAAMVERLKATDVTDVAVEELMRRRHAERDVQIAAIESMRDARAAGWVWPLLGAVVLVMVLEALLSPQLDEGGRSVVRPAQRRLVSVRYALIALILALAVARPGMLVNASLLMAVLVAAVALAAGLVPLGPKRN